MMQTYDAVMAQVARWALANFGHNETPYLGSREGAAGLETAPRSAKDATLLGPWHKNPAVAIGSISPLFGIGEEIGELHTPGNMDDVKDALGDITIYLCDYCAREGVSFPTRVELPVAHQHEDTRAGVVMYYGLLLRCHLKRLQRIRGMHHIEEFRRARAEALRGLVWHLERFAKDAMKADLLTLLNHTWNTIVKKRDWNADAAGGGGHTHDTEHRK